jgi:asparagine synthase (glutamine-hydrolysing)
MRHNYVPAPRSIYEGIHKLPAAHFVQFRITERGVEGTEPAPYWSAQRAAEAGLRAPFKGNENEATIELERLLTQSIAGQMIADVPLGAFLSGGIDSSAVVALMQAQSHRPVKTFTIGFDEGEYNEAEHAMAVARHLGCEHTELYVTPQQALDVIPRLPTLYDEPFADSSQVPTHLVSALARRHVTVSLSGDGGDELFGGYNRYFWAMALWRRLQRLPSKIRVAAAGLLTSLSPDGWNRVFGVAGPLLPARVRFGNPGDKLHKLAALMGAATPESIYLRLVSHWDDPAAGLVLHSEETATAITDPGAWLSCSDFEQRMMYLDTVTYLPDDILAKVDRAAMAVSLETRVPMLDHRVVEFAWRLPLAMKIRNGQGKWLLRQVLYRHLPAALVERPKMGFGVPIDHWLRGPLKDWAEDLLSETRLRQDEFFNPDSIRQKWHEHLSGRRNWQYHLWDVLMFQGWLDRWK